MNYRKIVKYTLRTVLVTAALLVVTWIGLFVYISKPYIIEIEQVRTSGRVETIRAYWGRACGEEFLSDKDSGVKLTLTVPEGGKTPSDTHAAVPDNLFIITGYRYKSVQKNFLTGEIKELPSPRVDVIKWHVVPPYRVYVNDGDALIKEINTPLGWQSQELEPRFTFYHRPEPGEC